MIIPKRDAKSYGAVHIDYYLTFIGFCKKVYSDEIQSIDVFIDGNKIDTIVCDKTIDKLSQIYDIEGHGFEYDLPEMYFDKRHLLSFRCSGSGEELVNSPISTICKDDEKFNEYKFLNSLSKPIDEDKIKDMYCPNSIGFLATEENLADEEFVGYIKELMVRFPDVSFKALYFDVSSRNKIEQVIGVDNLEVILLNDLEILLKVSFIFVFNAKTFESYNIPLWNFITSNCKNIHTFAYDHNWINKKIDIDTINRFNYLFKSTKYESQKLSESKTLYELWFYDSIEYALNSQSFVINNFNFRNSF